MEPRTDSDSRKADNRPAQMQSHLDNRYGRIGIPAVAAAVCCKDKKGHQTRKQHGAGKAAHYESD